jgi:hypothetical protein
MEHPKAVGDRTTLAVMLALYEAGYAVALPFGENTRYDLVMDDGVKLSRVQCKTGRLRSGAIRFKACSSYAHHANPKLPVRHYLGQIDYFGIHCPETGGVYLVPIGDAANRTQCSLRVTPSRNNQAQRIRLAAAYEIANFGPKVSSGPRGSSGGPGSCA